MSASRRHHAALIASQLASGAGSLLLLLVTARALGPSGRGEFTFFLLWPMLGAYLVSLGVPGANLRLVAADRSRAPALIGNTGAIAALTAAVTVIPLLLGPPEWLVGPMSTELVWLAWAAMAMMVVFQGLTWLQMGLGQFVQASALRGVFPAAAAAIFGLLVLTDDSWSTPEAAAGTFLVSVAAVTVGVAVALLRGGPAPVLDRVLLRESLPFALRYQGGLVAQLVTYRMDQWVLGLSQPTASLGVYSVAASVSEVATYPATARGMTRFREASASEDTSARSMITATALSTVASALLMAGVALVAIPPVFGEDFDSAVRLTLLLLPGTLGVGVMRVCANDLAGRGRPGAASIVAVVQATLMVAAFVVLIPAHGADAAAIISSVGYLLGGAATAVLLVRERRSGRRGAVVVEEPLEA